MAPSPKAPRLKVYRAAFGFHESVVAAPNQGAALKAWGTRQNLFAEGAAEVTTEAAAVKAALAHPQTPLRRAVGSSDPFVLEPGAAALPEVPPARRRPKPGPAKDASRPAPKPAADRSALTAAERALAQIAADQKAGEADFKKRLRALQDEADQAARRLDKRRAAAETAVDRARRAFIDAGGEVD